MHSRTSTTTELLPLLPANIPSSQPPAPWVSNIQQTGRSPTAAYYLWRGLAPTTRQNYDTPRARFILFCTLANYQHQNGGCFPAKVTWLIEWLCSLPGTIKVKTMKLYLLGLKSYQLDPGIECVAFTDPGIERTIQGIKRDHNERLPPIPPPLTCPYLLHILCHLPGPDYDNTMLGAAFTLAFAGFLRVGKFTYSETDRELGASFSKWFLTKQHIRIPAGESYMELTIPASKTDPFRKGITLTIAASGDPACPVNSM